MSNTKIILADGYALNSTDGYSWKSQWYELLDCSLYSISMVFVGGSPVGTITLNQSNDVPSPIGIGGNKPFPKSAGNLYGAPIDVSVVPSSSTAVSGAGVYTLNYQLAAYGWVQVVYTASSNVVTTLTGRLSVRTT
jgi:hypothetical protein